MSAALDEGVHTGRHPYHLMAVACVNEQHQPELRTVVLRKHDADARIIAFHTDIRSPKVAWLKQNPAIALLFYDTETKMQLRINGLAQVHYDDDITQTHWDQTRQSSKSCYLAEHGSSVEVKDASQCGVDSTSYKVQSAQEEADAYQNFAVIYIDYSALDVVQLKASGHSRALLSWDDMGQMQGKWVSI